MTTLTRCAWATGSDAMTDYHDREWGVPLHDDRALFELLSLEGAQAGLSWRTVLARRDAYRAAYHGFDIGRVAAMSDADLDAVLATGGVIRHRGKIASVRTNARAAQRIAAERGSLDAFVWSFVDHQPIVNAWTRPEQVPASTAHSERLSRALGKAGFGFVGPTICYAFMQASGMVNDHLTACFRHASPAAA